MGTISRSTWVAGEKQDGISWITASSLASWRKLVVASVSNQTVRWVQIPAGVGFRFLEHSHAAGRIPFSNSQQSLPKVSNDIKSIWLMECMVVGGSSKCPQSVVTCPWNLYNVKTFFGTYLLVANMHSDCQIFIIEFVFIIKYIYIKYTFHTYV